MNDYDTHESIIRGAYENSASYSDALVLGSLIGTPMHVEHDEDSDYEPLTLGDTIALDNVLTDMGVDPGKFNWLD